MNGSQISRTQLLIDYKPNFSRQLDSGYPSFHRLIDINEGAQPRPPRALCVSCTLAPRIVAFVG